MPLYLTPEERDALDPMALEELQANGGYVVKPKSTIAQLPYSSAAVAAGVKPPPLKTPAKPYGPAAIQSTSGVLPQGAANVAQSIASGAYPMQGTNSWISGKDAAQYLGVPYDPNALYQRPWDPSGPGIPLETLFNQMVRDQQNAANTQSAMATRELETAPTGGPGTPSWVPPLMRPGAIQAPQLPTGRGIAPQSIPQPQGMGVSVAPMTPRFGVPNIPTLGQVGSGLMAGLNAGREYVGGPLAGALADPYVNDQGRIDLTSMGSNMTRGEGGWYQNARASDQSIRENLSPGLRTAYDIGTDPLTYLGPGIAGKIGQGIPALKPVLSGSRNPIGALVEGVGPKRALPLAAGAGLGTELANRFDIPMVSEPVEQFAGGLLGGVAGLGAMGRGAITPPVMRAAPEPPKWSYDASRNKDQEAKGIFGGYEWTERLPEERLQGVLDYASTEYHDINDYLRGLNPTPSNQARGIIQAVDEAMEITPPTSQPVSVYRWSGHDEGLKPGEVITDEGFTSTTLSENYAYEWRSKQTSGDQFGPRGDVIYEIQLPSGYNKALPMYQLTSEEAEVLLDRGESFRVLSRTPGVGGEPTRVVLTPDRPGLGAVPIRGGSEPFESFRRDPQDIPDMRQAEKSADYTAATDAILNAVRNEANLRKSGTVSSEIMAGRSRQAQGIQQQFNDALGKGLSPEEIAAQARRGAAVGPLRQTVTPGIELPPAQKSAVYDELNRQLQAGEIRQFDYMRGVNAVQKLVAGDGLQPNEIQTLRRMFGDEMANLIKDRPLSNTQAVTQKWIGLTKGTTRSEELTNAMADLKNASPTEQQIASRYISQMQDRVGKIEARQAAKAERDLQVANIKEANSPESQMRQNLRDKWRAIIKDEALAEKMAAQPILDPVESKIAIEYLTSLRNAEQARANTAARGLRRESPSYDQVMSKVQGHINAIKDPQERAAMDAIVRTWVRDNQELISIKGSRADSVMRAVANGMRGDVQDSYLAKVIHRRAHLEGALKQQGFDDDLAKKITDGLVDFEVRRKYGRTIPQHIQDQLKSTRAFDTDANALRGLGEWSQELKNLQFGVADFSVLGQQLLANIQLSAPSLVIGMVNRILSAAHLGADTLGAERSLPKAIAYQLDGVAQGVRTGMTDIDKGRSILSRIPKVGPMVDAPLMAMADKMTDLQFGKIMTTVRNLNYEGNLVLAKLAGADINNPRVRAEAASFANANSSFAELAQTSGRKSGERAFFLTPTMRRAQVKRITNVVGGLGDIARIHDPVARTKAVLATATVASWGVTMLAFGKALHDYFGAEGSEFEMDPTKPGFGNLTAANGIIYNVFPQEQVAKAVARSIRAVSEEDWKGLAEEWGKLGVSSASPGLRPILASFGVGYDPERGYQWGDYGEGMDWGDRVRSALPLPPVTAELAGGERDPQMLATNAAGVTSYREGASQELARKYKADTGRDLWDDRQGTREEQAQLKAWIAANPERQSLDDEALQDQVDKGNEGAARVQRGKEITADFTQKQTVDDAALNTGELDPATWRENRKLRQAELRGARDEVYAGIEDKPARDAVDSYYQEIEDATAPNGTDVDWDRVDAWVASQPKQAQDDIAKYTGLGGTKTEKQYKAAVKRIDATQYWDVADLVAVEAAVDWRNAGLPVPENIDSHGELQSWIQGYIRDTMRAEGVDPASTEGRALAGAIEDGLFKDADKLTGDIRKGLRENNPDLMTDLVDWGFYDPGKEATNLILETATGDDEEEDEE